MEKSALVWEDAKFNMRLGGLGVSIVAAIPWQFVVVRVLGRLEIIDAQVSGFIDKSCSWVIARFQLSINSFW